MRTTRMAGPYDEIQVPRTSSKTDWEVELGVVIAREAQYLRSLEEATRYIAGFSVSPDLSEREFQLERSGQWAKGKSCDTFDPPGPLLATRDEVSDSACLSISLHMNGDVRQRGSTATMIFWHSSTYPRSCAMYHREPGDLISP